MEHTRAQYRLLFVSVLLLIVAATLYWVVRPVKGKAGTVPLAFYSWKNKFSLDSTQYEILKKYEVDHLHVKLLELSWNEDSRTVKVNNHIYPDQYENYSAEYFMEHKVTPVVFIENDLFYKTDSAGIREMAGLVKRALKIHLVDLVFYKEHTWDNYWSQLYFTLDVPQDNTDSLRAIYEQFQKNVVSYEFDCDWTEKTRDKYFYFLKNIRDSLQHPTEATLRLHQYKYRDKAGIPPVNAVNLMCYNMGDFKKPQEANSIFRKETLKEYMAGQEKYPLTMNVAFPAFSWIVVFRNNKFYKLIPEVDVTENVFVKNETCCGLKKLGPNQFLVQSELRYSWSEEPLQAGDLVRIEKVDAKELAEAYNYLADDLELSIPEFIIFDLSNTPNLKNFDDLAKTLITK